MPIAYLCCMISSFVTEIEGTAFDLKTMNGDRLQLFQVYVMDQGQKKRFHMHLDPEDDRFKIASKDACPEPYRHLEDALHEAIMARHASAGLQQTEK